MLNSSVCRKERQKISLQWIVLGTGFVVLLASCARAPAPPPAVSMVTAVVVEPEQLTLQAGSAGQLSAQANDAQGRPVGGTGFRFTVTDPKVLQVSDHGLVTALGPASAQTQVIVASGTAQLRVPVVVQPGLPQSVQKVSGEGQHLGTGDAPSAPLIVRVLDSFGNPVAGVPVLLEPVANLWTQDETLTGSDGKAKILLPRILRAGIAVAAMQVKAMPALAASFTLQVTPGPPAKIVRIDMTPQQNSGATAMVTIALRVTDAFNNPVPDAALSAHFAKTDLPAGFPETDATGTSRLVLPFLPRARRLPMEVVLAADPTVRTSFLVEVPGKALRKASRSKQ